MNLLILILGGIALVVFIIILFYYLTPTPTPVPMGGMPKIPEDGTKVPDTTTPKKIYPRRTDINDLGYIGIDRGWYDVLGQGECNDYCRMVGDAAPNIVFSCAMSNEPGVQYKTTDRAKAGKICNVV